MGSRRWALAAAVGVLAAIPTGAGAQSARVSGYVRRADSREVVRYAIVSADDSVVAQTNADGFYFLRVTPGRHRIRARAIGFSPRDTSIDVTTAATLELSLEPVIVTLERTDIVVRREPSDVDPGSPAMSVARVDLPAIRKTPAVLGEIDPIRTLTLLPGVSRTSDFSTAFSVRGGSADQNLILLDQATIYNPAHVGGFLSVFNADAVDDITLYKGAIPARYGGRLSSVLDVRQREGNANERVGHVSIGLLTSRLLAEGPLPRDIGSYLIAARRSYADVLLKLSSDTSIRDNVAYFYDLNAKGNVRLGESGALLISGYAGRDRFVPQPEFSAEWGNVSGTLRWNQVFSNRLLSKVTLFGSDYDYALSFDLLGTTADWTSRILSRALRVDETLHLTERSSLDFGVEGISETIYPGAIVATDTARIRNFHVPTRRALTGAVYADHQVDFGPRVSVRIGARASRFSRRGAATIYRYPNDAPVIWNPELVRYEPVTEIDSTVYREGATITTVGALEPRASVKLSLTETQSLKASYSRTAQYLLLASRTNAPTPLDVWEPVGPYVKPGRSDQYALGWAGTIQDAAWEVSAEVYAKRTRNVMDFIDGTDIILNPQLETGLLQGIGRAQGLELFARRQRGRVTGWISYTLGSAEQKIGDGVGGRGINGGAWFTSPSSKTHDLAVVALRPMGRSGRWTLGTTFVAASGLPTTLPTSRYEVDGFVIAEYQSRNAERLPAYHRLDLALTRTTGRGELQFGVFNVYNRFNAQSLSFRQNAERPRVTEAIQTAIFGLVPSISYTRRFGGGGR